VTKTQPILTNRGAGTYSFALIQLQFGDGMGKDTTFSDGNITHKVKLEKKRTKR
jgi:hypothetical protein